MKRKSILVKITFFLYQSSSPKNNSPRTQFKITTCKLINSMSTALGQGDKKREREREREEKRSILVKIAFEAAVPLGVGPGEGETGEEFRERAGR